jgi:uncharacterized coiled-coil protein SlyX
MAKTRKKLSKMRIIYEDEATEKQAQLLKLEKTQENMKRIINKVESHKFLDTTTKPRVELPIKYNKKLQEKIIELINKSANSHGTINELNRLLTAYPNYWETQQEWKSLIDYARKNIPPLSPPKASSPKSPPKHTISKQASSYIMSGEEHPLTRGRGVSRRSRRPKRSRRQKRSRRPKRSRR